MRLAWFSPFPPAATGVAGRSAELVAALRARGHHIDVFVEAAPSRAPAGTRSAHDFVWLNRRDPYDLPVFQIGNSSHHDYLWAYALRYPGLVVLHDTRLHHARAAFLLRERRPDDYRAEFAWNEPDVSPDAAELARAGFDTRLGYEWPLAGTLIATSRLTVVHGDGARRDLLTRLPAAIAASAEARLAAIRLGEGVALDPQDALAARARVRTALGVSDAAIVFGAFGGLTPEKRLPQILSAFAAILPHVPGTRLLLAGAVAPQYDAAADIAARGLGDHVTLTGYLRDDQAVTDHLAACDVSLNLRWPTARETSGPWLRALALGLPTVVTDLVHHGDVPILDPRSWTAPSGSSSTPIAVAIDILDEDHSLRLAMRRLATDPELRMRLGRAAAAYWRGRHTIEAMTDDYECAIARAMAMSAPSRLGLPPHVGGDAAGTLRAIASLFRVTAPLEQDGLL